MLTAINKNVLSYRFLHETDDSFKTLEFSGDEASLADIKILVAKASGLEREFARTFDLCVYLCDQQNQTLKELISDNDLIPTHSKIVIQRIPWHVRHTLEHIATTPETTIPLITSTTTLPSSSSIIKRPFPQEYLCPLCQSILFHPVVVRCISKCGKSACRQCIESRFSADRVCPFCKKKVQTVIPNKALAAIISKLSLNEFESPPNCHNEFIQQENKTSMMSQLMITPSSPPPPPITTKFETPMIKELPLIKSEPPTTSLSFKEETSSIQQQQQSYLNQDQQQQEEDTLLATTTTSLHKTHENQIIDSSNINIPTNPSLPGLHYTNGIHLGSLSPPSSLPDLLNNNEPIDNKNEISDDRVKLKHMSEDEEEQSLYPSKISTSILTNNNDNSPSSPTLSSTRYEFDPISNCWKVVPSPPPSSINNNSRTHDMNNICPFKSTEDVAHLFPFLSKKDFMLIQAFQRQLKTLLSTSELDENSLQSGGGGGGCSSSADIMK